MSTRRRWEYRTVYIHAGCYGRPLNFPATLDDADMRALNESGQDGWEFVAWVIRNDELVAMMKRAAE
jgi:hypothetical protein